MKTLHISLDEEFDFGVRLAQKIFFQGGVFVYPTDTIYGFGANPFNNEAVESIAALKQRDEGKKYILLISDIDILLRYVDMPKEYYVDFLLSVWPNPVTVVLPLKPEHQIVLGAKDAGFRLPNHRFCKTLLNEIQMPLISTSVNRYGEPALTEYSLIVQEFDQEVDAVFYTSRVHDRISSTVINFNSDEMQLIRAGRFQFQKLQELFVQAKKRYGS